MIRLTHGSSIYLFFSSFQNFYTIKVITNANENRVKSILIYGNKNIKNYNEMHLAQHKKAVCSLNYTKLANLLYGLAIGSDNDFF